MSTEKTLTQLLTDAGSRWAPMARDEATSNDCQNEAIRELIELYQDDPEALRNFDTSDWINLNECYTSDLIRRYHTQNDDIRSLFDDYCENIGATSTLEALEGQTIEDPEDMMTAIVNIAMTWAAQCLLNDIYPER